IIAVAGANTGIEITGSQACTVRNGTVRGFAGYGIYSSRPGCLFERLTINSNNGPGLFAVNDSTIDGCTAEDNNGTGFITSSGCIVRGCIAGGNGSTVNDRGFDLGDRSLATHCSASNNSGAGIFTGHGSRVTDCQTYANSIGIQTFTSSLVSGSSCTGNTT